MNKTKVGSTKYTGASDEAKLLRYVNTHNKTKNIKLTNSSKYNYSTATEYIRGDKVFYTLNNIYYVYANNIEEFIKILKVTSRHTRKGICNQLSDSLFEYTEVLNNGLKVREITKIIGIE